MNPHHAPLSPCDVYSEQIHLLVDRELGPAEEAIVEAHLQECSRCQVLVARLERMSSVLKEWDGETNDHEPPEQRLRHGVLARVAEQSVQRRRQGRRLNLVRYATAACVLIGLGLGVWFGLREVAVPPPEAPVLVANLDPWPAETRAAEGLDLDRLVVSRMFLDPQPQAYEPGLHMPALRAPEWSVTKVLGDGSASRFAFLEAHRSQTEKFRAQVGGPVTRVYLPNRAPRLVTIRAYQFLYESGKLIEWRDAAIERSSTVETPGAEPPESRDTGVSARQMLTPMPGVSDDLRMITGRAPLFVLPAPKPKSTGGRRVAARAPLLKAWGVRAPDVRLASGPLDEQGPRSFLDPLEAEGNGWLALAEGRDAGEVVALVEGTTKPIYIPAGQILSSGKADRVVAQPIWLPPSREKKPYLIPCRVVENYPDGNAQDVPRLTPWIAGPTIRALLAAGASQEAVKAAAAKQVAVVWPGGSLDPWSPWTLLQVYGGSHAKSNLPKIRKQLRWTGEAGFVATDSGGRFLGSEILRFHGAAAEELLSRLWLSYVTESFLRDRGRRTARDAFATPATGLPHVFDPLERHRSHFQMPLGFVQPEGACVSSLHVPAAGLHLHALEVDGRPAAISSLRSAPTP